MQLDALLEVAIGLVVTWLIVSMATSQVQEFIVERIGWRSRFLENYLMSMFHNQELIDQFYKHPLIQPLYTKTMLGALRKPTGIPNNIFAQVAVDIFLSASKNGAAIPAGIMNLSTMKQNLNDSMGYLEANNQPLAQTIKHLVPKMDDAILKAEEEAAKLENGLAKFRSNTEAWFDTTMSQATIGYRKTAQALALIIGFLLAWTFNVDSIHITNQLWRDPTLRQALVAQAGNINPNDKTGYENTMRKLNALSLPVGWNADDTPHNSVAWAFKTFGFFITATAAAQGAPFWFDILGRLSGLKKSRSVQKSKTE